MTDQGQHQENAPPEEAVADAEVIGEASDISGAANMVEEGAPLEPGDVAMAEAMAAGEAAGEEADPLAVAEAALAERTDDLKRLQAEFLNYKRRVERDRELIKENATFAVLSPITEVLDTVDRAREHDALDEGLRAVGDQLEQVVNRLGLVKFGQPGDVFDPTLHDALSHLGEDAEVSVTTVKVVAKAGYRIGERVVRAAQVLVVDPAGGPTA